LKHILSLRQISIYLYDTVFIKFSTKNWNGEGVDYYYMGTWEAVEEDGVYKMKKSETRLLD